MTGPAALAIPRARCSPQEQHGRRYAKYKGGRKYDPPPGAQAIRSNPNRPRFSIRSGRPPKEIRKMAWKKKVGWVRF